MDTFDSPLAPTFTDDLATEDASLIFELAFAEFELRDRNLEFVLDPASDPWIVRNADGSIDVEWTLRELKPRISLDPGRAGSIASHLQLLCSTLAETGELLAVHDLLMSTYAARRRVGVGMFADQFVGEGLAARFPESSQVTDRAVSSEHLYEAAVLGLAEQLKVSQNKAEFELNQARTATIWYPSGIAALWNGQISLPQMDAFLDASAGSLADITKDHGRDAAHEVADRVWTKIGLKILKENAADAPAKPNDIKRRVHRELVKLNTRSVAKRQARNSQNRGLSWFDNSDGTTTAQWKMTTVDAISVRAILEGTVRRDDVEIPLPQGVRLAMETEAYLESVCQADQENGQKNVPLEDQVFAEQLAVRDEHERRRHHFSKRTSDLLVNAVNRVALETQRADECGDPLVLPDVRPQIEAHILISLDTLTGLQDGPACGPRGEVIPAEIARGLAADSAWRRFIYSDVTGHAMDIGDRRFPTPAMTRLVRALHPTCTAPGCSHTSRRSDLDHAVEYQYGGSTAIGNLHPASRGCHTLKSLGLFTVAINPNHDVTWTNTVTGQSTTTPSYDWRTW